MTATLGVVVVDDQLLIRTGLALILEAEPDIRVVGQCENGTDVTAVVRARRPDVVLMDIRMPIVDGPEATRLVLALADPPAVLALTTFDDDDALWSALTAGAAGFVLKDSPAETLIAAVRAVAAGGTWLDPRVLPRVVARAREAHTISPLAARSLQRLTPRETDVLRLMCRGANNTEIAAHLHLRERTVKSHVSAIFAKLEARDRVGAVVTAYEGGFAS